MFVTNVQAKADIFNKFFTEQYTPLKNSSALPVNQMFLKQSRLLTSIDFNKDDVPKVISSKHKADDRDYISIRMIKICNKSLLKPLILLFEFSTKSSRYPDI